MVERDARQLLAALAGDESAEEPKRAGDEADGAYRDIIDGATEAMGDFDAATKFIAEHDLEDLAEAVERADADLSKRAAAGRAALDAFRRLRVAATDSTASSRLDILQATPEDLGEEPPSVRTDDGG